MREGLATSIEVCPDRFFCGPLSVWTADIGSPWLVSRSVAHYPEENCLVFGKHTNIWQNRQRELNHISHLSLRIYMYGTNYTARSLSYATYSR